MGWHSWLSTAPRIYINVVRWATFMMHHSDLRLLHPAIFNRQKMVVEMEVARTPIPLLYSPNVVQNTNFSYFNNPSPATIQTRKTSTLFGRLLDSLQDILHLYHRIKETIFSPPHFVHLFSPIPPSTYLNQMVKTSPIVVKIAHWSLHYCRIFQPRA